MGYVENKLTNVLEWINTKYLNHEGIAYIIKRLRADMPTWAKNLSLFGKALTGIATTLVTGNVWLQYFPAEWQTMITTSLGILGGIGLVITTVANYAVKTEDLAEINKTPLR